MRCSYGTILPGPKGEPNEPESINDTRDVYQGVGPKPADTLMKGVSGQITLMG